MSESEKSSYGEVHIKPAMGTRENLGDAQVDPGRSMGEQMSRRSPHRGKGESLLVNSRAAERMKILIPIVSMA